jgi:multidrug efflux pump subunit AcrB
VEYINQLKERDMSTVEAALEAGRIRLRPILMTSVATVMGALPIALGLGAGSESRRPLGYAIVGGLVFSTLLTLYVVPAVYVIFDGLLVRLARRRQVRQGTLAPAEAE